MLTPVDATSVELSIPLSAVRVQNSYTLPCTYTTSSPLDGMARNYYFFHMDMQEHTICRVWIHFIPSS